MSIRMLDGVPMRPPTQPEQPSSFGHAHFWERAMSRRQMLGIAGGGAAAVAASLLKPLDALADHHGSDPRPIPHGIMVAGQGWHVDAPSEGGFGEMSTIYDFEGSVGIAFVRGTGTGRQGGAVLPLVFDSDMRFMKGRYRGMDGRMYRGSFGFI